MKYWKLSAGTLSVIGGKKVKNDAPPTAAYVMIGEKCRHNCRFCAQSRESTAKTNLLSRITWPEVAVETAVEGISRAVRTGELRRACLQVVDHEQGQEHVVNAVMNLTSAAAVPVCVSSNIVSAAQAAQLLAAGADKICIAIDAATPRAYLAAKGDDWGERRQLLSECAKTFPGRVATHLIVGLGESEEEMVETLISCLREGITVGLFAFTPIHGTAWEARPAPSLDRYRRIQVAHYLLKQGYGSDVVVCRQGRICGFKVPSLHSVLKDGKAFQTSGCPNCNRPYYNERPGGVMYNYPRPLTAAEVEQAIRECGVLAEKPL